MGRFEKLLETLKNDYEVDQDVVDEISSLWDASPIRKERDDYKKRAETAEEKAGKYATAAVKSVLKDKGVTINPSLLRFPDDLDLTDEAAVEKFLVDAGLAEAKSEADVAEQQAHENIDRAVTGASATATTRINADLLEELDTTTEGKARIRRFQQNHPDEWQRLLKGEEVVGKTI